MPNPHWKPLTAAQEDIWYAQTVDPENPDQNLVGYLEIRGPLQLALLEKAFQQVMAETQSARLRFRQDEAGPRQAVEPLGDHRLPVVDLRGEPEPSAAAEAWMRADAARPVDLRNEPVSIVITALLVGEGRSVAGLIGSLTGGEHLARSGEALARILPIRTRGSRTPLFCVHPATGVSWGFAPLAASIPAEYPLYGVQAQGLTGAEALPQSIAEMAADYVRQIRAVQPAGPYQLLGCSLGGVVAQEVAVQLREAGLAVDALVIMDSYAAHHIPALFGLDVPGLHAQDGLPEEWEQFVLRGEGDGGDEGDAFNRRVLENSSAILRTHVPRVYEGDVLLVVAAAGKADGAKPAEAWAPYVTGDVRAESVPCRHEDMTQPDMLALVGELTARRLEECG